MPGILYIVATPIGNLEDMTYRAVRILSEADLIAAEDTRHSRRLLNHFGISKPLTSYFDHNQQLKGEQLLTALQQGKQVALISDAGTPCISDPGYTLVRDAAAAGITVIPVPGACAAITALSAGGLPSDLFTFAGFPPARQAGRRDFLARHARLAGTLVLYEAPHRLLDTLDDIRTVMGERQVVVARELSKIYEEFIRGTVTVVMASVEQGKARGEVVILIHAGEPDTETAESLDNLLQRLIHGEKLSVKDAALKASLISGSSRSECYAVAIRVKNDGENQK